MSLAAPDRGSAGKSSAPAIAVRTKALASAGMLAAALLAVFVNVLAARHYERWDATRAKIYSLSPPTDFTLDQLEREGLDVELFVFVGAGDPLLGSLKQILATYQAQAKTRLHVRFLDPDRDRAEFLRVQTELEVNAKIESGRLLADAQVVVRHGTRVWYVKTDDMLVLDEGDDAKVRPRVESAITGAIRAVLSTDRPRVCFTAGHQEASLDDPSERGLSTLKNTLLKDNFAPTTVDVAKGAPLTGCVLVAIVAPTEPFRDSETRPIVDAVAKGAALLLVVPPEIDLQSKSLRATGLDPVAALAGVSLDDAVTVEEDPALREQGELGLIFRARVHAHPTTDDLRRFAEARGGEAAVPLQYVRSLQKITVAGAAAQELLVSSDQSFALHDVASFVSSKEAPKRGASDRKGPLDLAVATTRDRSIGGARAVVVGASTPFVNAAYLDPSPPRGLSRTLGLLWVSWLTARPPILDLPPKPTVQVAMHLSEEDLASIARYVLLAMPLATALLGGAVWFRRRATEGKRLRGGRKRET
ncbi:MAG: hypothetical protein NVS3B10_07450 [Polyangiales bacterium]